MKEFYSLTVEKITFEQLLLPRGAVCQKEGVKK